MKRRWRIKAALGATKQGQVMNYTWKPKGRLGIVRAAIETILTQLRVEERLLKWMKNFGEAKQCAFEVHGLFLRYYRAGEPGNHFDFHIDDSKYTFVICFPPWDHCAAGKTVVYDSRGKRQHEWAKLEGSVEDLRAVVPSVAFG